MHKLKVLMNTSSWINLFEIGLHEYLVINFKVYTTSKVKEEILEGKGFADDALVFENLLKYNTIKIISNLEIPNELKHEISISSGEIELAACALGNTKFIILIDDSKVYRVLERFGIIFISSANIVVDAYINQNIDKEKAITYLEKLRRSLRNEVIDNALRIITQ